MLPKVPPLPKLFPSRLSNLDEKTRTTVYCNLCWLNLHHKISPIKFEWVSNDVGILRCPVHGKWIPKPEEYKKFLNFQKIASSNDGTQEDYLRTYEKEKRTLY